MENGHLHDDKLFRAVQNRLSDYEVPYNGAEWNAMSRSLDKLPKTSRFHWRFSLNTLLAGLGVAGLSILGYAVANHSGKPVEAAIPVPVAQTVTYKNALQPQNELQPAPVQENSEVAGSNGSSATALPEVGFAFKSTEQKSAKDKPQGPLLFGDQIDRAKGFIKATKEDKEILAKYKGDPTPHVYYDLEDGTVKKVEITRDSGKVWGEKKNLTFPFDSASNNNGIPTDDGNRGFNED
ncbi:MAG TPA: hypothetical protein VI731_02555 [Bacteroidia bacterium]|nr:hypothetical protein [Bacteroidia bacterium]